VYGWSQWGRTPAFKKKFSQQIHSIFQNIRIFAARLEQQI
jgi:hypothetical protein